ncbi:MAG: hypothetical protein HXS42_11310 [Theionarchaea archaeon]|nr:hypothetical protein [Theionarchaea archaeon]
MLTSRQLETVYSFMQAFERNPRISYRKLFREYCTYRSRDTVPQIITQSRNMQILLGPRLYVNANTDVEIINVEDNKKKDWKSVVSDEKVTYALLLSGGHHLLAFRRGATVLIYAEAIKPSFPAQKTLEEISPEIEGELPRFEYPRWGDLDWEVYRLMGDPRVSFVDVGSKLGISWQTVKNHYEKILEDCRIWISFFPRGRMSYYHLFFTFSTSYELGIREELTKLDRTSYLFKYENTLILFVYSDSGWTTCRHFSELEKKGILRDLRVSIPVQWHRPEFKI